MFYISSPLEQFNTRTYLGITSEIFNLNLLSITSFTIYSLLTSLFIIALFLSFDNNVKLLPNRWLFILESIYFTINKIVKDQFNTSQGKILFPFIFSLFIYILFSNLISLIPYSYALNAQLIWTLSLSIILWFGCTLKGLFNHGWLFFGLFLPSGTNLALVPILVIIELLSYIARAFSLGLRLGSNILAGHLLLVILGNLIFNFMSISIITLFLSFFPLLILLAIICLESAIAVIQAIVFTILTCSYIKDALYLH